jgi:hypothetical protein
MRSFSRLVGQFIIGVALTTPVAASGLSWLGLFNDELLQVLENANQLEALCPPADGEHRRCREARLASRVRVLLLRVDAAPDAALAGQLWISANPLAGLSAFVVAPGGYPQQLQPDLYDSDWGYGPYFHQTVIEQRGDWYRLPLPLPTAAWLHAHELGQGLSLWRLAAGEIVTSPRGDVVVMEVQASRVLVRPEQPADLWCEGGEPPAPVESLAFWLEGDELFDRSGRLRLHIKYTRGC